MIEIGDAGELRIDLRLPIGPAQIEALSRLGLGGSFAVVTACNPRGRRLAAPHNERRGRRLHARIAAQAVTCCRADGVAADASHREPGFAVATDLKTAVALAAACEQSAIFWFDGLRFRIVPVLEAGAAAIDLPAGQTPAPVS
ncbi:MAG: DUF3293 domain-containing protein [Deltaproteobacteria bacterium]|nr:DUF3293 domain-containing protein [Deltaproteobacteria bacterium]